MILLNVFSIVSAPVVLILMLCVDAEPYISLMIRIRPGLAWTDGSVIVFAIEVVFTGIMEVFPGMLMGVAIL